MKLTKFRFDVLKLCATYDKHNRQGIPAWAIRHLKPSTKRAANWLIAQNLVYYDAFGSLITTHDGYWLYKETEDYPEREE